MRLPPLSFTVFDTETTGVVPRANHIIEFASVRVEPKGNTGVVADEYEQLLSPPDEIPPHVQVLTRIKPEAVAGKPTISEKKDKILAHIGSDTLLIGQNLSFDLAMLKGEGIDLSDRPWLDTALLASLAFPEFRSFSLPYMSAMLKLTHEPRHRALGDVRATLQLLSHVWERFLSLAPDDLATLKECLEKAGPAEHLLASALVSEGKTHAASWKRTRAAAKSRPRSQSLLPLPKTGTPHVLEEGLSPATLQEIVNAASADASTTHWIAVKNLESSLSRLELTDAVRVLTAPGFLLDPEAAERLLVQARFTPEEATIAVKLRWFSPRTRNELALHGGERDVWAGKLACTDARAVYTAQFVDLPGVVLLDHRQLLQFLAESEHAAHDALQPTHHIIIDDASMLEDTATKAYGRSCFLDSLRAAASGDPLLQKLSDLTSLWVEKIRTGEDNRILTANDLTRKETKGILEQIAEVLQGSGLPERTCELLQDLAWILTPGRTEDHVAWIEQRFNGSFAVHALPERVDQFLLPHLYQRFHVTLLAPEGTGKTLPEILPTSLTVTHAAPLASSSSRIPLTLSPDATLHDLLRNPPAGKSIVLTGSKRQIEHAFIQHTEALEAKNIALICQGLSGGQGRMEAEFLATEGSVVWLLTPWMYEGIELPADVCDHLFVDAIPFDHPGHPLVGRRKDHYNDGFSSYCLPRTIFRLFRLLRTFCRHRTAKGGVTVMDKRLWEKSYGRTVQKYLMRFAEGATTEATMKAAGSVESKPGTMKAAKKAEPTQGDPGQMTMF